VTARIEAIEGALTREGWDEALGQFAGATFFHQYGWAQLVRDVYDGEPHYLAAKADGSVCGLLPMMTRNVLQAGNVCISLPMADEGGILSRSGESTQALIDAAQHIGQSRQVSYIEIRQREELPGDIAADLTRVGLELSLPGTADELWDSLKATVRNQVRKAQKSGLTASVETNCHAAVDDGFYPIYSENTRDLGSPMHSRRFFHEVLSRFPDLAQLVVVREDLAPVTRWQCRGLPRYDGTSTGAPTTCSTGSCCDWRSNRAADGSISAGPPLTRARSGSSANGEQHRSSCATTASLSRMR